MPRAQSWRDECQQSSAGHAMLQMATDLAALAKIASRMQLTDEETEIVQDILDRWEYR